MSNQNEEITYPDFYLLDKHNTGYVRSLEYFGIYKTKLSRAIARIYNNSCQEW